jgi:molybdate transport system ATP-binding protein
METRPPHDPNHQSDPRPRSDQHTSPDAAAPPAQRPFLEFSAKKLLHTAQGREWLDIQFQLEKGQTLAIYGPSGAGKTTLLRILAGLTEVSSGHIRLGDETWLDTTTRQNLPTRRRAIGFVFQDFALFPNLTVREQLEYALPRIPMTTAIVPITIQPLVDELLALMELEALQHHRPALLSGGQQQRVALARAIARRPSLLLLDEPLSALDDEMRNKLQEYLVKIQQRFHLTTILVSHHIPEIFRLADTVITLKHGRIETQGSPATLYAINAPATPSSQISFPATIINIQPTSDQYILTFGCAGTVLSIAVTSSQAANLRPDQTITVTLDGFTSTST